MSTFLEVQAYTLHQYLWLHHSRAQTITGNSLNTIVGCARPALTGVLVAPLRHRCLSCFRLQIIKMDSGRSGSKGKGFKTKVPVSTNQNSAHQNSDRTVCGSSESGSHPVSSSGTGCAPKDSASTMRNSAQSHIADKTTSGPCGSSSRPVSSSGTERAPSVFNPPSVWGSKKLDFSVGGHSTVVPMEGDSISSSETERAPSGFKPPSVGDSKTLDFSVGGHNIVVPTEGNSRSGAPSAELRSRESESMEVQENPHVVRESKGAADGAIQRVERSPGKSVAEPSGSVTLQASSFDTKKKQRAEGSNLGVMNKGLSASSESKDQRGNKEDRFDGRRGDRGGRRGGYGSQRGEYYGGNRGGRREGYGSQRGEYDGGNRGGGGGGRGQDGSQRGESDRIDALGRLLSSVLRHRAVELKLNIRNDGYVAVEELLKLNVKTHARVPLYSHSVDDIREAVKRDNKQRFGLREEVGILMIRANQGHSIELVDSEGLLKPILSAEEVPVCVHGTYLNCLESIMKDGLKRMKRNHVHFARGLSKDSGVISGMRGNCEVLIYLDAKKALQDGMKLFISENGVILTEGFEGVVPPKYFAKIETLERKRSKKY